MPFNVVITTNGISKVRAKLEGNISRSTDLTVPMKQGALLMMGSINENFMTGGRPQHWRALAPKTLKRKIRQGLSPVPLTGRTGILRSSIASSVTQTGFKLGTSLVYARIHQRGGQAGRNHATTIPARPYLVFQDEDIQEINKLVVNYIKGK